MTKSSQLDRRGFVGLLVGGHLAASALRAAVTLIHRPYLQNVRADGATVLWATRENLEASVTYSADGADPVTVPVRARSLSPDQTGVPFTFYQYRAELPGLAPGKEYSYRVTVGSDVITSESRHRFKTPTPGRFSFLALGDSGDGSAPQQLLAQRMAEERPDLALHVGDIAYEDATFEQFQAYYFEYYASLMARVPFFTAPGNHEYFTPRAAPYLALITAPAGEVPAVDQGRYYSFDWGDAHFVSLDSNLLDNAAASQRMLTWLEADLQATTARWRIAFFHHLPYPLTHHVRDPLCRAAREMFLPILERYGVQLVLTGHEHSYQRSKLVRANEVVATGPGTLHVVTGGGGARLNLVAPHDLVAKSVSAFHYLRVEVTNATLTVRAIGTDGKEIDRAMLANPVLSSERAFVNAASFSSAVAPGSLVTIFGEGLANDTATAQVTPLPRDLSGTTVTLNDVAVPLVYVSPGQINAQVPAGITGASVLRITTASGEASLKVEISETAPAIFASGVRRTNGTIIDAANPARAGETLLIYLTGLGRVDAELASGAPAPAAPPLRALSPVDVRFADTAVTPTFAGLAPGLVGVYQVIVDVPPNLPEGTHALRIVAGGASSTPVSLPVRAR
ncbi:MAG: metallophosphoesterase [Acidobacteria bacterium]|nr:metallophosphoesterase [Acidobacteriota bacterium]